MKYVHKYSTFSKYSLIFRKIYPNISLITELDNLFILNHQYYKDKYLTFDIKSDGVITWTTTDSSVVRTISYSKNGGEWVDITSSTYGESISVTAGDKIQFKGKTSAYAITNSKYNKFGGTATFDVYGNIMSLLYRNFKTKRKLPNEVHTFNSLFRNCITLLSAKNLILPATTLRQTCYEYMFDGCTSLTTAPELPATILTDFCYANMFSDCTSLTTAPELPATTLADNCYYQMFKDCTSLTTVPQLPATTLTEYCYRQMFYGCTSLTTAPALPATTLADYCYHSMFYGCTSLTTVPILPATTLAIYCYQNMFYGCTSLTTAPALPATILASNCYQSMFYGCTSLATLPELPATTLANYCYKEMFYGCTSLTTVPLLPATTLAIQCYHSMFRGCTSLTIAPALPATTLAKGCYYQMFRGCTLLTTAPTLPATTLAEECYSGMFYGCTSLTTTPALPATTLAQYCYDSMFYNCTLLVNVPSILPATTLANNCYRQMFYGCTSLAIATQLPATILANNCYQYMFNGCTSLTTAPELPATILVNWCYYSMFAGCILLNYIKCLAIDISANNCVNSWVNGVASTGTFVKTPSMSDWPSNGSGIPSNWTVLNDNIEPIINCYGDIVEITCQDKGADIYYDLNQSGTFTKYTSVIEINSDTIVDAYSEFNNQTSSVVTQNCVYVANETKYEISNKDITTWTYNNQTIQTPYSVNAIDGHSPYYALNKFDFKTSIILKKVQQTYLWFQHADQSAEIYVDDVLVTKHWGGYNAFFVDITNYIHAGANNILVRLNNNEGNKLAPASGDFNFNATLGNVKLFTSPVLPDMKYGYDGFHVTSTVSSVYATVNIETTIPSGASITCTIMDGSTQVYTSTVNSTGQKQIFTTTISNPHLWNGKLDPHLYDITLDIYKDNELYHSFTRPYGLRYYSYVINETVNGETYTGFLLNGQPYLLRGCCMHDDIAGKANALNDADYTQTFNIIKELGCNFLRLAHYPHPKEVYDRCDQLGIIVQTEVPLVNILKSNQPEDYYTHLEGQYIDMVNQHYNHPCIMFWGLGNEFNASIDTSFAKIKLEYYRDIIKNLDAERLVGCVLTANSNNPVTTVGGADLDWYGCNIYVGWYSDTSNNNPTSAINTRYKNVSNKAIAFSEYGCGGTQQCHSEFSSMTTDKGTGGARHDIEYQMWIHEGHIAAIKNFPKLLFTSEWQLFDIAVSNRNEGYTVCLDGLNDSINNNLRRLNDKGLVERDHITKKDTFYLYKAWWSSQNFVHICGKDYTNKLERVIKCYTNAGNSLDLYVNGTFVETATVTDNICTFTEANYSSGDIIRVDGTNASDTFTFA